jgi:hypothetical protein
VGGYEGWHGSLRSSRASPAHVVGQRATSVSAEKQKRKERAAKGECECGWGHWEAGRRRQKAESRKQRAEGRGKRHLETQERVLLGGVAHGARQGPQGHVRDDRTSSVPEGHLGNHAEHAPAHTATAVHTWVWGGGNGTPKGHLIEHGAAPHHTTHALGSASGQPTSLMA